MIRILTRKEFSFLQELKMLVLKYDAVFFMNSKGGVKIKIYEEKMDQHEEDELGDAIDIHETFDENELGELLKKSVTIVNQMTEEYKNTK